MDVYKWVIENKKHFDLSDDKYDQDNDNKKGIKKKNKDELNGVERQNLTALNPRIYCFKTVEDKETRKAT